MRVSSYSLLVLWSLLLHSRVDTAELPRGGMVVAWGSSYAGQALVPEAALSGVVAIAAGISHSVALKSDGSVVAWGDNYYGQVSGTPNVVQPYSAVASPVAVEGAVSAIAAGRQHTVYLMKNGSVVAYGDDGYGPTTVPAAADSGVVAIAAGAWHTLALKSDGTVVAWGGNSEGQITGIPTDSATPVIANPVTLGGQALRGIKTIAAAHLHTVALRTDGSVVAWGNNDFGQTDVPVAALAGVVAIASGGDYGSPHQGIPAGGHSVALKNDGSVLAWGNNRFGQTDVPATALSGVVAIVAGATFTIALKNDGPVVAWGDNRNGQTKVPEGLVGVTAIAAGGSHTMVLVVPSAPVFTTIPKSRLAHPWQSPTFTAGAIGFPLAYQWRKEGVDIAGATNATYSAIHTQLEHAGSYSVVVSNFLGTVIGAPPAVLTVEGPAAPGTVVAWGDNQYGQTIVPVAAQSGVSAVAAGANHTVALKSDGSVLGWGRNDYGETTVPLGAKSGIIAIAAGGYSNWDWQAPHSIALKNVGTVVAWGNNAVGQVTGSPTQTYPGMAIANPVILQGKTLCGVSSVAAGALHTVALKNDGSVVAWGANGVGQATVPLAAQSGVMAIAAGPWHTVALKSDGSVLAWGSNDEGQTGVPLTARRGVTAIAAGATYTVALKADGTLVFWGNELMSQANQGISDVVAVAAGAAHTMALTRDGSVVVWGYNDHGQVTGTSTLLPSFPETAAPVTLGGHVLSGITAIAAGVSHSVALIGAVPLQSNLSVNSSGNEFILSWPTIPSGYTLQESASLTEPGWKDIPDKLTVLNLQNQVVLSARSGRAFFRLRSP